MSDTKIIKAKLRRMLPTLDLETATQRTIQQQLEDELGMPLEDYKHLIKNEVDAFLLGVDPDLDDSPAAEQEPPAKKPRKEVDEKPLPASDGPADFIFSAPISKMRYAGVKAYKSRPMIDVREYYEKDGELAPGAKGLSFTPDQWHRLTQGLLAINEAMGKGDQAFYLELGSMKRANITIFSGKTMVNLREHYEKDGKFLPGKKGISLVPDQWTKLCAIHEELTNQLENQPGGKADPERAAAAAAAGPSKKTSTSAVAASQGSKDSIISIALANMRRAEVTRFKGNIVVDVREFYEKDGALAHTEKGLQMIPEQFKALRDGSAQISTALKSQNTEFALNLAPKKRATISNFKGKYYVDLREWYERDGNLAPTPKGISLAPDQWEKLEAALPHLAETLSSN